jgi:hypothetical protein
MLNCLVDEDVEHIALHTLKLSSLSTSNLEFSRLINSQGSGFAWFVENNKNVKRIEELPALSEYGTFNRFIYIR